MPPAPRPVLAPRDANATSQKRHADHDDDDDAGTAAKKSRRGSVSSEQKHSSQPLSAQHTESASRRLTRQKIELLRLRLALANYKVRTGQESLPLERLESLPLPGSKPRSQASAARQPSLVEPAPSCQASADHDAAAKKQLLTHHRDANVDASWLQKDLPELQANPNVPSLQDDAELPLPNELQKDDAPSKVSISLEDASPDTWQQNTPSCDPLDTAPSSQNDARVHHDSSPSPPQNDLHCLEQSPSLHLQPPNADSAPTEPCPLPSLLPSDTSHESPSRRGGAATSLLWLARGGDS
ncbi:hypothetical protein CDD81_1338 [Ophiocordyceps australis]|uniref:Uncharacterized protein n=1 Tax=Ophiocordyceps australis TaxID=1399860 RepID=A0A2C5XZ36_9HYPO|nr:hypothetical protein CDD81_1338 [Ophiocordyceps australis]